MSKVIHKLNEYDIITQAAFESPGNKEAGQILGYTNDVPETIVKRDASGTIAATTVTTVVIEADSIVVNDAIEINAINSPNIDMTATQLGFFGGSSITQPISINAPIQEIRVANDNDEESAEYTSTQAAIAELQEKVGEIITTLKELGLVAT